MRTATGLDVYAYGHSIIARLDQLRAVQMMLNVVKLSAPCLAQSEPGQPARWHMVHSIHFSRHTVYWVQAQVGFGRVYFPGPNRVGARADFMRWAQPILRLSRRACARANDGLVSVNAGQPLMKNLAHFVKSVL